jgi:hypothetical protein
MPPAHHETSKHDSPNKIKIKVNHRNVPDSNSNLTKSMTHHNQTKELTTWFFNLPLDESIDNKKHKVWRSNPKPHEAQLEDQKSSRRSSRRGKSRTTNKMHEKRQNKEKSKEKLKIKKLKIPLEFNSP